MKKLFSYMICVVGLVLVMCGSAGAAGLSPSYDYSGLPYISIQHPDGTSFYLAPSEISLLSLDAPVYFFAIPRVSGGALQSTNLTSSIINQYEGISCLGSDSNYYTMHGLSIACSPGDLVTVSMMRRAKWSDSDWTGLNISGRLYVTTGGTLVSSSDSQLYPFFTLSSTRFPSSNGDFTNESTKGFTTGSFFSRSLTFSYQIPDSATTSYLYLYDFDGFSADTHYGCNWLTPDSSVGAPPPDWLPYLPDYALEKTQQSILSKLDTPLTSIVTAINNLSTAVGTPSAMDKFENDYLGNEYISGQLDKTEQFISPSNPGLPNGGDVGGFAEQIQQGMGFNGSSFDSEKFQQATDAFKVDSTSMGEGGMWWFFSQDVADSLAHDDAATVSDDDGQSLQDAWVEQIKRRWGNW